MDSETGALSARMTEVEYPVDVDDLIADRKPDEILSFSAAGGWAVVASNRVERALLFSIASGPASNTVSLTVPSSNSTNQQYSLARPFSLCTWVAEKSAPDLSAIGVAILSFDAVLRLYPYISVQHATSADSFPCHELRIDDALARSVGSLSKCQALKVVSLSPAHSALAVFGTHGSAALVKFDVHEASVLPLMRNQQSSTRPSHGFKSMFYSAIRSISSASATDSNWRQGDGPFAIVDVHPVADGLVLVRYGGSIERWSTDRLLWTFHVFPSAVSNGQSESFISSSAITSEGTLVLLLQHHSVHGVYKALRCYDVRDESGAPTNHHMSLPLDNAPDSADSPCRIVVCSDIVYLFLPGRGLLAWRSVARGVSSEGQVQGSLQINPIFEPFCVVEASRGLAPSSDTGIAACFHQNGVFLTALEVPPPVSHDLLGINLTHTSILSELRNILWRSFRQYYAAQKGASRSSLEGLLEIVSSRGYDACETLSQLIFNLSRDLITNESITFGGNQTSVLVESGLMRKLKLHRILLQMLSDAPLFTQLRSDAPSIAEDRIWDAIDLGCRLSVLSNHEYLASVAGIRKVENGESTRDMNGGFNDASSQPIAASREVVEIARALRTSLVCQDESLKTDLDVLSMALDATTKDIAGNDGLGGQTYLSTELYRWPFEISRFVVHVEDSVKRKLEEINSRENSIESLDVDYRSQHLEEACSVVSLGCEVSIAILENTLNAHIEGMTLATGNSSKPVQLQSWLHDSKQCIASFCTIAKLSLDIGQMCVERQRESIMSLAVLVLDEVLACTQPINSVDTLKTSDRSRSKRRRLNLSERQSEWHRILRKCLSLLIRYDLQREALRLAEKYKDFDTMMDLKVTSEDFNTFMSESLRKFGEEFAHHAFQWLEDRGKIELLLQGRPEVGDNAHVGIREEMEPLTAVLSEYFGGENKHSSNLAWMHWLAVGDVKNGSKCLVQQLKHAACPGHPGSLTTSRLLGSIAKLALVANAEETEENMPEHDATLNWVTSQVELGNFQYLLNQDSSTLMDPKDVVRSLVDNCDADSKVLSDRVLLALNAVRACELTNNNQNGQDYVWRRCIDRQSKTWIGMAEASSKVNDIRLRAKLTETAFFAAGSAVSLSISEVDDMLRRDFLAGGDLERNEYLEVIIELIKTTVGLYNQADSDTNVAEEGRLSMSD